MDASANKNPYPWWKARIWHGMALLAWLRLLGRYRFALSPGLLHRPIIATLAALGNSALALAQQLRYGRDIAATRLPPAIFIVGHWRTGTTFLQELMAADSRFMTPDSLQCMCPDHFLISGRVVRSAKFLLPATRPMDNFEVRWDVPQEDEAALLTMGARSPYEVFAFPGQYRKALGALDIEGLPRRQQAEWRRCFVRFLKSVVLARHRAVRRGTSPSMPKFLLLKSPSHTARLRLLAAMFPEARFIHLSRNREALYASSLSYWRAMITTQVLKVSHGDRSAGHDLVRALTLDGLDALYANFHRDRAGLGQGRIMDVAFDELVGDPLGTLAKIHRFLAIDPDEEATERLRRRVGDFATYEGARHAPAPADEALARGCWASYPDGYRSASS